jgi:hypothetical protein
MDAINRYKECRNAYLNIMHNIDTEISFPGQVFKKKWHEFYFFQSDRMFNVGFFGILEKLMSLENSEVCCFLNMDETVKFEFESAAAIFVDNAMTENKFYERLYDGGPAVGWLYGMDTYACSSNIGNWCVYCEKANDIAVIGFVNSNEGEENQLVLQKLYAKPIVDLIDGGRNSMFPFSELVPDWRKELVKNYM